MSIRLKLIFTYILTVAISVFIVVFLLVTMMGRVISGIVNVVVEDSSIQETATEAIDLLVEIRHMQEYDEQKLLDRDFQQQINDRLAFFKSGLIVYRQGDYINIGDFPKDEEFYKHLIDVDTVNLHDSSDNSLMFDYDGNNYFYFNKTYQIQDEKILYYFVTKFDKTSKVTSENIRGIVVFFMILVILLIAPIILIIQIDIIRPLKELERGAKQISDGNLDFKIQVRSLNEVGTVVYAYEKMRQELKKSIQKQIQYENNRKELISSITHDLKTPITSIKGYVEGILDGVANTEEKKERYLKVIQQKSLDMDRLIDDLFLFSKLDLNKLPFEFESISLPSFIKEVVEQMALDYKESAVIEYEYENQWEDEPIVSIDKDQIKRVLQNLVQNGVKYNKNESKQISVHVLNSKDEIILSVKDNGIGMNEDEIKHAFDMFYRSDTSRNSSTGGSGLGLAIVKHIISEHKGTIQVKSSPEKGTTIRIIFNRNEVVV